MATSPGGRPADDSPVGTPGGRQNWVDKAGGLPKYVRMVAHALMRKGMSEQHAIAAAVNRIKRWAAGLDDVRPQVQAAAVAALAEWNAKKGMALSTSGYVDAHQLLDLSVPDVWQAELEATFDPALDLAAPRDYVRDQIGRFANDSTKHQGADRKKRDDGKAVDRDRKVTREDLASLKALKALMLDWRRVPFSERNAAKARMKAAARRLNATPRLLALIDGLGDGDAKAEKGEGSGAALREGKANAWLKGQGFNLSAGSPEGDLVLELAAAVGDELDGASLIDLSGTQDGVIDLAPGDHRPPYDWKHGYIPITPAAAASKAKKGPNVGKGSTRRPRGVSVPGKTSRATTARPRSTAGATRKKPDGMPDAAWDRLTPPQREHVAKRVGEGAPVARAVDEARGKTGDRAQSRVGRNVTGEDVAAVKAARFKAVDDEKRGRGVPGAVTSRDDEVRGIQDRIEKRTGTRPTAAQARAALEHAERVESDRPKKTEQRKGLREPLSTEKKIPVSEVEAGDVVVEPGRSKTTRYRIDTIHPPKGNGDRNVTATDLETGRSVDMSLDGLRQQLVEKARQPRQGPSETGSVVRDMEARRARRAAIAGGDYPTKADGSPDYAAMSATQQHQVRAKLAGRGEGAKVTTDQGPGTVTRVSSRGTTIKLDSGDSINVVGGTPGHDRIKPAANAPAAGGKKPTKAQREAQEHVAGIDDHARLYSLARNGSTKQSIRAAARDRMRELGVEDLSDADITTLNRREREGDKLAKAELAFRSSPAGRRERAKRDAEGNARYLEGQRERRDKTPVGEMSASQLDTARAQNQGRPEPERQARFHEIEAELKRRGWTRGMSASDLYALDDKNKRHGATAIGSSRPRGGRTEPGELDTSRLAKVSDESLVRNIERYQDRAPNSDTLKALKAERDRRKKDTEPDAADLARAQGIAQRAGAMNPDTAKGIAQAIADGRAKGLPTVKVDVMDKIVVVNTDIGRGKGHVTGDGRTQLNGPVPAKIDRKLSPEAANELSSGEIMRRLSAPNTSPEDKRVLEAERAQRVRVAMRSNPNVPAAVRDQQTAGITSTDAKRMSDDQLERAMSRLMADGSYSGPAFAVLEAELNRRDKARRAEGNGPRR